jgi:2Fe-2S ferredoxin
MQITYVQHDGSARTVKARLGASLMEVAVNNAIPGIVGECNGSAACATCHVVLPQAVFDRLVPPEDHESDMLDFADSPRQPCSRLGCQVRLSDEMDGMTVTIPA